MRHFSMFAALNLIFIATASRGADSPKPVKAPPLHDCKATPSKDLGLWDDVFVPSDENFVLLRRGEDLFSLSLTDSSGPTQRTTAAAIKDSQMLAGARSGERLWVLLNSHETTPFALDVFSGEISTFEIPGLNVPGQQAPGIQSHVIVPQADAVLLMVSGGDQKTWPRDGNRPLYFWLGLKTGKVVRFPTGWDLEYFSDDQKVAVFDKPNEARFERRPLQGIDVQTGESIDQVPDQRTQPFVAFHWTETLAIKALYSKRPETGDAHHFAGLSVGGLALPMQLASDHVYLASAAARDGYAGFRLRPEGGSDYQPSPFWVAALEPHEQPQPVATLVTAFTMLGKGNALFVATGYGHKETSSEAFVLDRSRKATWNLLEEVPRLPALDKKFADKDYIEDRLIVRPMENFGTSDHDPLAFCLLTHSRGDRRAFAGPGPTPRDRLESITWRRAMVVTTAGERYMTDLFRKGNEPDKLWLHNSGKLLLGTYTWDETPAKRRSKLRLSETVLQIPRRD